MRFSTRAQELREQKRAAEKRAAKSLERLREKMADDDGLSSYGTYKCPIF